MQSARIRQLFLQYFGDRGHQVVPSSSLVPADDPTLLFTNAGMVQFKRVFLGQEHRDYARATTCQKCVRAGGKHNDLEQVGLTRRHHTFFEMLGNFSFGDYFKRDAIAFAWEFVTSPEFLAIPAHRLRVTVHHTDDEARQLWSELSGLPPDRIYGLGDADNFWQMGDTGPCGPCSEIYVDLARSPDDTSPQEVLDQAAFEREAEAGRFLEIWNLVFMQFDRAADGTLTPLPKPSVDTGAGLERIASVLQGSDDNFHTDLFAPLLERAGALVGRPYDPASPDRVSYRVLADHARAVSFLLADGVYPSNEGRGYVLRRILRRAVRHAWLLGRREPTLAPLTEVVVREMGGAYPGLVARAGFINDATRSEEERFLETIEGGLGRLEEIFSGGASTIDGEEAFRLYDTFGFPVDLTQLIAGERGVTVDLDGFERALEQQRERSRDDHKARHRAGGASVVRSGEQQRVAEGSQEFVGYEVTEADTDVLAISESDDGRVGLLLRENPFYAESGGQVSDTGLVEAGDWRLTVDAVYRTADGVVVAGPAPRGFAGGAVHAQVEAPRRREIERHHSATHLVHHALRSVLGTHVRQQGSLVEPGRLRFDFSHHGPIDPAVLADIESMVNQLVLDNAIVTTDEMAYRDALALGAMAFFADKYGDRVRVVQMGPSIELCGGTHVRSTGQIGLFRFSSQGGVAAGVRRIEAVSGTAALRDVAELERRLASIAGALRSQPDQAARRVEQLIEEKHKLEGRLAEALKQGGGAAAGRTIEVGDVAVTLGDTSSESRDEVGQIADAFRGEKRQAVLVLFGSGGRGAVHVAVTDDLVQRGLRAGDLVNRIAAVSGGKGGGRPQFASAGAGDPDRLEAARNAAPGIVAEWLSGAR